ncbi:MAG: hypothetical protein Q8K75_07045 [Chlamydiales bacterium]|nr:hypothetical protein [Chlamydiales bacterium]
MEIRNSASNSSPYYAQGGGGGSAPSAPLNVPTSFPSQQRDQLVSLGAPTRNGRQASGPSHGLFYTQNSEEALSSLGFMRKGSIAIATIALLVLVLMLIQPVLAILLSLGMCLMDGCQEWWEFTQTVLSLSLWPAGLFAAGLFFALGVNLKMHDIAQQMTSDPLESDPLRFLARKKKSKKP